uniref:MBF2 n=1 Tax=Heliothis virescens TaxID=7102 RepID=A0A2A4JL79_HELVI
MKVHTAILLLAAVIFVECGHTFMGTSVLRPQVYHKEVRFSSRFFHKRVEYLNYTLPAYGGYPGAGGSIQGILAFDMTHSGASANVTRGGIGYNFVDLRMKSDRNKELHYDVYIYA